MHKIYWLCSAFEEKLTYASSMRLNSELCRRNPEHATKQRWSRPIKVIGPVRPATDFEWTVYGDVLLSSQVGKTLHEAGFSGFELRPAEILTSTETPVGREVFELSPNGWGGVAPVESGVRVLEKCPFCKRQVFSGYTNPARLFDLDAWDGSDFFVIWPLPRRIMVTGRVGELFLKSGYTGARVRPLGDLPRAVAGKLGPGHLADWFDGARLAEISQQVARDD
jgi:hypothetical protein